MRERLKEGLDLLGIEAGDGMLDACLLFLEELKRWNAFFNLVGDGMIPPWSSMCSIPSRRWRLSGNIRCRGRPMPDRAVVFPEFPWLSSFPEPA